MKKFTQGFLLGTLATIGAVAAGVFSFHKTVVSPIEDEEQRVDDNRRRAVRKSRSSHLN
ncbi:MAG: DUF3042 family protein [Furfurilactobacillus sp.]|jgi:hypothetical protein|uniref:DUF3042 domain-containing protein n=3 Tax=Furfurilactobacillus TaxID=2767882 RepID=A0A0R1RM59_9LACO|nr:MULTISPECIES: DUF3042 family protein [Furfurilactobacillus]KRL57353.1 hypothetical protein FD35_GL000367 [Furfurilactobacillus rossiae DSM 15814]MCF6160574.1 DUF3042 family protein [Furfurilactobacillus milii]MCF6162806.1 DUF3042 family protein [Furfurilactobacillus milii]MCF6164903.1 DUF3042 family protein [Furfurilactobacillus rossiae]MCF6420274.1 DUF3042 family protein [Furfurilactobacillus milii]